MDLGGILRALVMVVVTFTYAFAIGGKIPYFIFYVSIGLLVISFVWSKINTKITAYCYAEAVYAQVGTRVKVVVEVKNESGWPVPWVQCWVKMPETFLLPDNLGCYAFSLSPQQKKVVSEEIECKFRGCFPWGQILVRTGDIFGIFTISRQAGEPKEIVVLPEVYDMGVDLEVITGRRYGEIPFSLLSARRGTSFIGVRKYEASDGIARIHWKASAHTQSLLVKEFQEQKLSEFTLFLDMNEDRHCGTGPYGSAEKAVALAASLASTGVRSGHGIGLRVYGAERSMVAVGYGKGHFSLILRQLVRVQPGKDSLLGDGLSDEMCLLSKNGHPLIITGYLEEQVIDSLVWLNTRRQGSVVFLLKLETFGDMDINYVEREEAISHLRGSGVSVVMVEKGTDLRLVFRGLDYEVG